MKLIIFDLDQTLVDFIALHDETTRELFQRFFGVDAKLTDIDFAGRSLSDNFAELARLKNVPENMFKERLPQLLPEYNLVFTNKVPADAKKFVLPGVIDLLEGLSATDNLVVLYTGDPPGIIDAVFRATGLGKYFRFCQCGTEFKTRSDMVRALMVKAEKYTGKRFIGKDIVIIGDSLRDIEAGKELRALTIAVATGFHSAKELAAQQPDFLFPSLKSCRTVMQAIGGK